jgi:hypothetical protein
VTKIMTKDELRVSAKQAGKAAPLLARFRLLAVVIAVTVGQHAFAQTSAGGISFYPAPPNGFNPVAASDSELTLYGFPARPPLGSVAYSAWASRMANLKTRTANPVVQTTGKHSTLRAPGAPLQASTYTSASWSGVVASGVSNYFSANASYIDISFQVPTIVPPTTDPNCSMYGPYSTAIWGGMDGFGNNDLLQAGVNLDATAGFSGCSLSYTAWYEWYTSQCLESSPPCYQTSVSLTIHPGDWIYIQVAYYTSGNSGYNGYALISNQTTGIYPPPAMFNEPPPVNSTTQYQGATAEWIVERLGGQNLLNFRGNAGPTGTQLWLAADYSDDSIYGGAYSIGYGPESTISLVDMICPPWNPSSNCPNNSTTISYGTYYPPNPNGGYYGVFVYPTGPAVSQ